MYAMLEVSDCGVRVDVLLFRMQYKSVIGELEAKVAVIEAACDDVKQRCDVLLIVFVCCDWEICIAFL